MSEQKVLRRLPIRCDTVPDYQLFVDLTVCADGEAAAGIGADDVMRLEAVSEAYQEDLRTRMHLGSKLIVAAHNLPDDVTEQEQQLVLKLEAEVDAAFGHNAHLYGRAVALFAIRDLAAG